jgi:hypothetical protein
MNYRKHEPSTAVISLGSDNAPEDFDTDVTVSAAVSVSTTNHFNTGDDLVQSDVKFVIRVLRSFCHCQLGFYGPSRRIVLGPV